MYNDCYTGDLKQKKQETQNQVSDLQTQLNSLMTKISDLENDLIETGEEISQTEEDLKTAQEEQEQQYAAMKLRIKYMYEAGDQSAVESLVDSEDFSDMVNKAEYVRRRNRNCYSREGTDIRRYFQCTDAGRIFPAGTFL